MQHFDNLPKAVFVRDSKKIDNVKTIHLHSYCRTQTLIILSATPKAIFVRHNKKIAYLKIILHDEILDN